MNGTNIEIRGWDKFRARIMGATKGLKSGVKAATVHIEGKVKSYPPATLANKPKTYMSGQWNSWYQRGWGSKWALADGSWKGTKSSEQLQQKWTTRFENGGLTGIVGNNATYAVYVMGERKEQATALKAIGWKSVEDIAEQEHKTVQDFIKAEVDKAMG